jgi:hypothetical protein
MILILEWELSSVTNSRWLTPLNKIVGLDWFYIFLDFFGRPLDRPLGHEMWHFLPAPWVRKAVSKNSAQSKSGVLEDRSLDASTHPPPSHTNA